ncbi:MAG: insulinase family protein [Elusimicrobia bacterium]|nr:insulinase family protein [Elusimicrobiota bacterium]
MTSILLAVLVAAGLRAAESVQAPLANDPMQTSIHRLGNGLTVYLSPNPQVPRVYSSIAVRAGGKDDPDDSTGMAHYLEHMLFKGSQSLGTLDFEGEKRHLDKISALYEKLFVTTSSAARADVYREIDRENVAASAFAIPNDLDRLYNTLGITEVNAYTTDERTVYVSEFPANRAEHWATVEGDRFARPVFRLFQSEIEAVYEEKNRSMDNPDRALGEALEDKLYKHHPYGQRTVLGSIEHLKNPSLAKMYAYYHERYRPSNMAVALSGDFDREKMLELIEKHFGAWQAAPAPPKRTWPLPEPRGRETVEVRFEAEERAVIAWPTAPTNHPDEDALEVMDMIMDNSQAGLINLRLNQAQRLKVAGSYPNHQNDAGSWRVWGAPKKGQTVEQVEALLMEVVDALKRGDFTEEDVRAVITDFEVSEKRKLESNDARVGMMVDAFATYDEWPNAVAKLDRLRKVTKADVLRVARKYLGENRVVAYRREGKPALPSIQKPSFTKVEIDPKRESAFFKAVTAIPTKKLEPRFLVEDKDYVRRKAEWGRLYASQNPINDLFSLTFVFDIGRKHQRTVCEAMRLLELSGAGELTAEDFKKRLYALGSSMNTGCGEQQMAVSLSGLESNLEKTLELVKKRFEAPKTATDTLKNMIEVQLGQHKDNKKNQGYIFHALNELARKGKRSTVLQDLSDDELKSLDPELLRRQIGELFANKRAVLYVGLRKPEVLAPLLGWGSKPWRAAPKYEPRRYERTAAPKVLFVPREQVQANVGMFAADEIYDPKKAVDYLYYNLYMGGGMSGVIFQEIREARALAYSSSGGYGTGDRKGDENLVWGSLGTQADKTVEAAMLLRKLLQEIPMSAERFAETKKAVEEDFRTGVITFREVPGTIHSWEERGIEGDPRPARFKRALGYEPKDLQAFAKRFEKKVFAVYVLGHGERVDKKGLAGLGEIRELKIDDLFPY